MTLLPLHSERRGATTIIAIWAIAIAAVLASSMMLFAYRQSGLGFEAEQNIKARWAARAGIENAIATMALHTENPIPDDAFALIRDLEYVRRDELLGAAYDIEHYKGGRILGGPLAESTRLNINTGTLNLYDLLIDISLDQIAGIVDWTDEDDEPSMFGAESDHYLANYSYEPRNGTLRSVIELELVAGIWADYLRGEDWNLNNRFDPNENDGAWTLPDDNADGFLDSGWFGVLTVWSVLDGVTDSGLPRIHLKRADTDVLMERCGVSLGQAQRLISFGMQDDRTLEELLIVELSSIAPLSPLPASQAPAVEELTSSQLRLIFAECSMKALFDRQPGKLNINLASEELITTFLDSRGVDEEIIDEILFLRNSRPEGIVSILDLEDIPLPQMSEPETLAEFASIFTTRSNVFSISSVGRSTVSGLEIEINVVVDRSTVPVRILEYREQ